MTTALRSVTPFRFFTVRLSGVTPLSPTFARVTFTGPDLDTFADNGADQRIKLVVPLADSGTRYFPLHDDGWYREWQRLPDRQRNPLRTYTVRAVRPAEREVDLDVVRHAGGTASDFLSAANVGAQAILLGPDARYPGAHGGVEWRPPAGVGRLLLAGDETAVPAILSICAALPPDATGHAVLEVPEAADFLDVAAPSGLTVTWLARGRDVPGARLVPAVIDAAAGLGSGASTQPPADVADDLLWEVPDAPAPGAYAWIAGEAGVVKRLRRHLVGELGVHRSRVAFMGYWRLGHREGG